jgi:DNA polymerase elongation subunit (family B)
MVRHSGSAKHTMFKFLVVVLDIVNCAVSARVGDEASLSLSPLAIHIPLANILLAEDICKVVNSMLPVPMALKFETYCEKVILFTKKRYILVSNDNITYRGVMNARRDYCAYAKKTYSDTMEMVAKGMSSNQTIKNYIDWRILRLIVGKVDMRELVVTKSLARQLSTYKVNQPHVVLAKRLVQKTGIDIPAGTRLEYIYVQGSDIKMVTPDEFLQGFSADGMFYVEKQLATQIDDILDVIGLGAYIKNTWLTMPK